jgi:hypothetical protein
MKEVGTFIDVAGPVTKTTLDEFGWLAYINGVIAIQAKDGVAFCFRHEEDIWMKQHKDVEIIKLHSFYDIAFVVLEPDEMGKRYLEYNIINHTARLVDKKPDAVHERDQCCYIFMTWTESYNGNIAYDAIVAMMKRRKKK